MSSANNDLPTATATAVASPTTEQERLEGVPEGPLSDVPPLPAAATADEGIEGTTGTEGAGETTGEPSTTASVPTSAAPAADSRGRSDSLSIQPHQDTIGGGAAAAVSDGSPVCNITLLLPTGARHPFRIDDRYLTKRNVEVPDLTESGKKDPFTISIYKLKELILREWREEWEGKPASPSSIRLIHFGKLLDDKEPLSKYQFSAEAPNVVHMTVKPPEMVEEDEAAKSKTGGRESRGREHSSNACCVIL